MKTILATLIALAGFLGSVAWAQEALAAGPAEQASQQRALPRVQPQAAGAAQRGGEAKTATGQGTTRQHAGREGRTPPGHATQPARAAEPPSVICACHRSVDHA